MSKTGFHLKASVLALALAAFAAPAFAADLPTRKSEPAEPRIVSKVVISPWSGAYAFVGADANWIRADKKSTPYGAVTFSGLGRAWAGGSAAAGYMFDMGSWAIAPEIGVNYLHARVNAKTSTYVTPYGVIASPSIVGRQSVGSAVFADLRAGLFNPSKTVFFYGLGGVVGRQFKDESLTSTLLNTVNLTRWGKNDMKTGYMVGVGAEGKITGAWTLRGQYVFEAYPSNKGEVHRAELGVGYHF